jgi:tRNA pseudouridine55 synthase
MPFYLIDKPVGPTSHDIVDQVRRLTGEQRVGHAGTLDPFASGLLIVAVGRESTKDLNKFIGLDKEYEATFVLGAESDTDDVTGKITPIPLPQDLTEKKIKTTMKNFIGEIKQTPPAYSAVKIGGKKMYEAARAGQPLEAKARAVTIYEYEIIDVGARHGALQHSSEFEPFEIRVRIRCSSGTYIRALARDLGRALETGGYVSELRRTAIGQYKIKSATVLPNIKPLNLETT